MVHQAIHIPDIAHNLLSTMQLRLNDVLVNDVPRFLTDTVTDLTHSLVIPTDATDVPYVIPLSLRGITSTFPTRRPTTTEYETLPHITLTDPDLPWDPHDTTFAQQEDALTNYLSETGDRIGASPPSRRLCSVSNMHSFASDLQRGLDAPSVPNVMVMDGAREQTMGLFRKKCREVGTRVRQTEPHTPWSNAAEAAIRELKKGVGRQMVRSGAPKRLWDDCLEREAYVRSLTAHDFTNSTGKCPRPLSAAKPLTYHHSPYSSGMSG
ncbi:hypothetical protein MHU86_7441 [Fragilaria crotonensis]|nr:hypothetical protein MHU86_7441 [Fragilaria crotonensis]